MADYIIHGSIAIGKDDKTGDNIMLSGETNDKELKLDKAEVQSLVERGILTPKVKAKASEDDK